MTFERKKVATALAHILGIGGAAALVAAPAQAQSDIRVEVTGSNIKRVEGEGALPVQTITREEINKTGVQTTFELLDRLSASMSFNNYNETIALGDAARPGFAGVSLRGLGPDKTLVLLNGRRITNFALGVGNPGVDLNAIPISAIERVEILKDGASAIYGTDAIAGVINFITRKDFTGVELSARYDKPEDTGGEQTRANVTAGFGDLAKQKFNGWITFDWQKNEALAAKDREFSKTAYLPSLGLDRTSGNSFPANVLVPAGRNPSDPTPNAPASVLSPVCAPPVSFPTTASPHQCRYDYASRIDIIDPSERYNVLGRLTWQFLPDHQAFLDAAYSHNKFTFAISEVPWSEGVTGNPLQLPPTSPFYPTAWLQANYPDLVGQPLDVLWRTIPAGRRTDESTTEQTRVVAGVKGTVFKNWDYEAAYNYNKSEVHDRYIDGWLDEAIAAPLFASGILNPFGDLGAAGEAALQTAKVNQEVQGATGTVQSGDFKLSGDVYQLPAGPLGLAVGGEYRQARSSSSFAPTSSRPAA